MGAFPEDYEIKGSKLICLWIGEGFIKSNRDHKSLEEVAEEYLKDLVERNLLIVRRNKSNRKAMSYVIHDVLRDLCIPKANEDNFLYVMTDDRGRGSLISKLRRVSTEHKYSNEMEDICAASTELMSLTRSFRRTGGKWWKSSPVLSYMSSISNLLRVLDIMDDVWFIELPKEILQLVNLRYLGVNCERLCVGISRLVNLQILINSCAIRSYMPSAEIWKMSELRYLKFRLVYIWSKNDDIEMLVEMNKLQTIKCMYLTESLHERGFLQAIPNIKKLGISWPDRTVIDLSHLHKLETLTCGHFYRRDCGFPHTLTKLSLYSCKIFLRTMTTLCGLLNLEVLKIKECTFELDSEEEVNEWEVREGEEFRSLQFLQLHKLKLVHWRADETNFPELRHLLVEDCSRLEEIPSGIGEIPTLELIEMKACSTSSVESAKEIVEVQHSEYGNYALQLRILHE